MVRRLLPLLPLFGSAWLLPAEALADQCAYVTPAQSRRAIAALEVGQRYVHLCEPCGQMEPGPVATLHGISSENVEYRGYRQVSLDGEPIDLAYVFVETEPGRFENLAKLARCQADGVSPFITVAEPTEAPVEPAEACPEPEAVELPAPVLQPHVYVEFPREVSPREPSWPTWLAFGLGGMLLAPAWAALWFGLWFVRRRRSPNS